MGVLEDLDKYMVETYKSMRETGLLLGSIGSNGRPNAMTIGWGLIGIIWNKPIFLVAVRISRYTHKLLEESGVFTVNVPREDMNQICEFCGTVSGRDVDKFEKAGLRWRMGSLVKAPIIEGCPIAYECKVIYKNSVSLQDLSKSIVESIYPRRDWHTLYYGEILKIHGNIVISGRG